MKYFLFVLVLISISSGSVFLLDFSPVWLEWLHNMTGLTFLAVFILYTSDHIQNKSEYLLTLSLYNLTGLLALFSSLPLLISGLYLFMFTKDEIPELWLTIHLYCALLFIICLLWHRWIMFQDHTKKRQKRYNSN